MSLEERFAEAAKLYGWTNYASVHEFLTKVCFWAVHDCRAGRLGDGFDGRRSTTARTTTTNSETKRRTTLGCSRARRSSIDVSPASAST
jgi:hypothetical protein